MTIKRSESSRAIEVDIGEREVIEKKLYRVPFIIHLKEGKSGV